MIHIQEERRIKKSFCDGLCVWFCLDLILTMGTVPSTLDHRKEFTVMSSSAMRKNPAMDQKLVDLACFSPLRVAGHYAQGNKDTVYKLPFAEQFLAAVLFVDMSGFTPLSEKLSSKGMLGVEELSTHLNSYFSKLVNIVYMVIKLYFIFA